MSGKSVEFGEVLEVAQDYKLLQARNSKEFVQLMVDVCAAINGCPMGKLQNLDVDELKSQSGFLIYYQIKGLKDPIPCDVEFITQIYSHFRKPTIIVLRRIQKHLSGAHRRILARMEREQALERVVSMGEFDVSAKIRAALNEMGRFQAMANLVRGGGRKLDILTQALNVPTRSRFELITVDRILRDPHHIRHEEAMEWLENSKFKGNVQAVHGLIKNGFQMLESAANKLLDLMEELSGISFPRDSSAIDLHRNWYSLGNSLPRGEEFVKSFTAEEAVEHKIKRLTFPMVRVGWDADRLRNVRDRILTDLSIVKIQGAQLSNLIFDLEKRILSCNQPDGEVMVAIETDFNNNMLSIREREDAETWAREAKIKLQELMMETYDNLKELKEANPKLALPEALEATIERIRSGLDGERQTHQQSVEQSLNKMNIDDLAADHRRLEGGLDHPTAKLLDGLVEHRKAVVKRSETFSIKNIEFHKKVRQAFSDFSSYENKVMELYKMEEQLEHMRIQAENWLINVYRNVSYEGLPEKQLNSSMEVIINHQLLAIKKLEYEKINAELFESYYQEAIKREGIDRALSLDQLLQEVQAIPRTDLLLQALKDWEKDLKPDDFREKERFLLDNNENLQVLTDKIRAELRELINSGASGMTRRLRFEVFGLSDCYCDHLRTLMHGLVSTADRLANEQEGEQIGKGLQSLESQVIEAQRSTRPEGDAYARLTNMAQKDSLDKELVKEMEKDLNANFKELDQLLVEVGEAMRRVKLIQNKFGAEKETNYLDVTININDIDKLKDVYEFVDGITMEDTKRFCVTYNLKQALMNNAFQRALKKDPALPKEVMALFTTKNYELFTEKRFIPLPLRTAIMTQLTDVFEAECQLLIHTLNLVKALNIRKKASYQSVMALLGQSKGADHQVIKTLGLLWGRIQTRLFNFKPQNHIKNYEGNRQALMTDVKDNFGEFLKR